MNRRLTDDRFAAALTFAVIIASTLATGAALFGFDARPAPRANVGVVQMPAVEVTGRRETAATASASPAQIAAGFGRRAPSRNHDHGPATCRDRGRGLRSAHQRFDAQSSKYVEVVAPAPATDRTGRDA